MGVSADAIAAILSTVVLGLLGFFGSRGLSQIDKNLAKLWERVEKLTQSAADCDSRHDLTEERLSHAAERLTRLENRADKRS